MKIVTIVPVRSTSRRLPGKIFLPLLDTTIIDQFVNRIKRSIYSPEVILATPWGDLHNFSEVLEKQEVSGYQGDLEDADVLSRLWFCALSVKADFVVRANADNPCMDPAMITHLLTTTAARREMLGTNIGDCPGTTWPRGLGAEVYSMDLLENLFKMKFDDKHREHPHLYCHENKLFSEPIFPYKWKSPLSYEVNTLPEYEYIKSIYEYFGNNKFTTEDLLELTDLKQLELDHDTKSRDSEYLSARQRLI